jgi:hypothetical protein
MADTDAAETLQRLKRMVTEAQSLTQDARTESLTDDDYYHGHQLTRAEKQALAERGQPDIVINRVKPAINGILGVTEQGKSEPRAFPRTPQDDDSADVATDCLRYIADHNRFSRIKQDFFRDMLVPGSAGVLIGVDEDRNVRIENIRWEELLFDPKSRRPDFSDGRFLGIYKWMYADDVTAMYPEKKSDIEGAMDGGGLMGDESFQDRPSQQPAWVDKRQRRLVVVEIYYRDRTWKRCVFIANAVLEEGDSPYQDDKGRATCPIEAQSAYVDRNNNRYGAVRDMRGPQDEVTKRRSKLLHLVTVSQIQAVDPAATDVDADTARREAARPDGVIPFGWQKVATADMAAGQAQLLQEAKGEIERLGPNPAILGRQGADSSGRAVLARQQAGMVELAVLFGALEDWELRVYRQCWARVKQFWTAPMVIRVTDDEDAPKFVGLNEPQMGPPQVVLDPATGLATLQPTILGYKNAVAEMDVDITLESMPDVANIQAEQFRDLMQLVGSSAVYQQQVPMELLLELSAVPHKRQILDRLKKFREEQQQAQAGQQQAQQQIAVEAAQADIAKTQSEADLNTAKTQQTQSETVLKAVDIGHKHGQATPPPGENNGRQASQG